MNNTATQERGSVTNERVRLQNRIDEIAGKLRHVQDRHAVTGESQYAALANRYRQQFAEAESNLVAFDARQTDRRQRAVSEDTATARVVFDKSVERYEKSLNKFAADSAALIEAAKQYADASGIKDPGRFPHKHIVLPVISARAHVVLNAIGLKFGPFVPPNAPGSLVDKWSTK